MVPTISTVKEQYSDSGFDFIGKLFATTIEGKRQWTRTEFEDALEIADIDAKFSPCLSNRSNFVRSLKTCEKDKLIRRVSEDSDTITIQSTREYQFNGQLNYSKEAIVTFDKNTCVLTGDNQDFIKDLRAKIGTEKDIYHSDDLRRVISRILQNEASAIAARKSVYFVTEGKSYWCDRIETLLEKLKVGHILSIPLVNMESVKDQMEKAYNNSANNAINELTEEIKVLKDKGSSAKIIQKRMAKIKELKAKAELYQDALCIQVDSVKERIKNVERDLAEALLG